MKKALHTKFTQHIHLQRKLLSTNDAWLVEHTKKDEYWGDGGHPTIGLNGLGFLLMELRSELQ